MKIELFIISLAVMLCSYSCTSTNNKQESTEETEVKNEITSNETSAGKELYEKHCVACHKIELNSTANPIAPAIFAIQLHYKPMYPDVAEFEKAMVEFLKHPTVEKSLMPGAVKKFGVMPLIQFPDNELSEIAKYIFSVEKDDTKANACGDKKTDSLSLNGNEKWKIDSKMFAGISKMKELTKSFSSKNVKDYQKLGKDAFGIVKETIIDDSSDEKTAAQIKVFFHKLETSLHELMTVEDTAKGDILVKNLNENIDLFSTYFEEK